MSTASRPPWWPTAEQKRHADAGCGHPYVCKLRTTGSRPRDAQDAFEELDRALAVVREYSHRIAVEVSRPRPDIAAVIAWRRASDIASAEVTRLLAETSAWLAERGL